MADTIRFGKVSNIDYETGCMEIKIGRAHV